MYEFSQTRDSHFFGSVPENEIWQFQCSTHFFLYFNKKAEIGKTGWQQATYRWTMIGIPVVVHAPQFEKLCFWLIKISVSKVLRGSQDSTVHTATCYRLDDLGFKPWWEQEFSLYTHQNWTWGSPTSLLYHGYQDSLPGVKLLGHGVDHLPSSIPDIMHE